MDRPPLFTRREFMSIGTSLVATASTVPWFLGQSGVALADSAGAAATSKPDRILVIIQLAGGNDGLNTLVPFGQPEYYRLRPRIAVPEKEVLALPGAGAKGLGLNPALAGLDELFSTGKAAVLQAVGYPNPNRSHFVSMDIWQSADPGLREASPYRADLPSSLASTGGWIGRVLDQAGSSVPQQSTSDRTERRGDAGSVSANDRRGPASVAIGRDAPLCLRGRRHRPLVVDRPDGFRWSGDVCSADLGKSHRKMNDASSLLNTRIEADPLACIRRVAMDAQATGDRIEAILNKGTRNVFPRTSLGSQLQSVSAMISAGLAARVYFVTLGGFDTHSEQVLRHSARLRELAGAVSAFYQELEAQGRQDHVLTMTFSEFGRQIAENASQGTDHGEGGPVFLFGPMVKPGLIGPTVDLAKLARPAEDPSGAAMSAPMVMDAMPYTVDFRCLYSSVIEQWLGGDPTPALGERFAPVSILRDGT